MREIKFRAWEKVKFQIGQKIVTGLMHHDFRWMVDYNGKLRYASSVGSGYDCELEAFEIMQYTGLKDKNGKEIYEGDIIQTYFSFAPGDAGYGVSQKPFIVAWDCKRLAYRAKKPKTKGLHLLDTVDFFTMQSRLYEVIGNIYDQAELLKEERV